MKRRFLGGLLLCFVFVFYATAQQSDNGNGTYTNPILWSDFPDNDVIRVGDTYYMVTTTMYIFPGVPVMKSKDLVNWEYCANAIRRFDQGPAYDMQGKTRYGHGQWASSIRYHNGQFHILFVTLDEGGYHLTADRPEGPWTLHKLPKAYYDAGLFYDDDGRIYIVHGYSKLSLTEVDENLAPLGRDSVIFDKVQRKGLEGSHVYKINGYYYIYATYGGGDGYQVALRSKNIYGPYEEKVVLRDDMNLAGKGVHQGALLETPTGEWWSVIFQDRDGIGRCPTLQPVHWVDGWPIPGDNGRAVVTYKKPGTGDPQPVKLLPTSDEFDSSGLGLQWGWNHNPDDGRWSLTERKGFLRLRTASVTGDLTRARNTLTQRPFGPYSTGTMAMDLDHMHPGDIAGLGIIQLPYAYIGAVAVDENTRALIMVNNGKTVDSVSFGSGRKVYFRALVSAIRDEACFFYSLDNKKFQPLGDTLHMKFDLRMFTGNKFALFNFATVDTGGFVDIDWFRMEIRRGPPNLFKANARIEAEMYDHIDIAHVASCRDSTDGKGQAVTQTADGAWIRYDRVDFEKGYAGLLVRLASATGGGRIELFLDEELQHPYATLSIPFTGSWNKYGTVKIPVKPVKGIHTLTVKFAGAGEQVVNLNWLSFTRS
ncbi:MAG: family 43 glycosylhydrolase [Chitinophagaceae bacterium]|nr:family 43 glycosylhydrolase [Chitinophagaceae bacterium]